MDRTKEDNQNDFASVVGAEASEEKFDGDVPNPIPNPKPNPNPNPSENNNESTSTPHPVKKPHFFDLNLVYIELDDNDTKSEVAEPAIVNELPEIVDVKENVNENDEPGWDVGNRPTNVINISDSDSDVTHTSDDGKKTILFFKPEAADKSLKHDWGGIEPFVHFVHNTAESSLGAQKRKFMNELVKVKEEKVEED